MKHSNKPPTEEMIRKLKNCLERELEGEKPFLAEEMKSSMPGLYRRGLIVTKMQMVGSKPPLGARLCFRWRKRPLVPFIKTK